MHNGKNKKLTLALFWISIVLLLAVVGLAIWGLVMAGRRESFKPLNKIIQFKCGKEGSCTSIRPCCCNLGKDGKDSYCVVQGDPTGICSNDGGSLICMTSSESPN